MSNAAGRPELGGAVDVSIYFKMARCEATELVKHGCRFIEVGGGEARVRWAASRARHHPWGSRARPGLAAGTQAALLASQSQLIVCSRGECRALVHLQTARKQARKAGRSALAASDGCASRLCTLGHVRPRRFAGSQEAMAEGLLGGSRTLVLPPASISPRSNLWGVPNSLAGHVATRVLRSQH